ncbi:MAG: hypothetical protein B6D61_05965 [Bacteroidetes bacterium 4484_249]|nr:MAG: hypothetical protein B6D61_05965 [Bacteroidetes bacterium 4484_249]
MPVALTVTVLLDLKNNTPPVLPSHDGQVNVPEMFTLVYCGIFITWCILPSVLLKVLFKDDCRLSSPDPTLVT